MIGMMMMMMMIIIIIIFIIIINIIIFSFHTSFIPVGVGKFHTCM